MRLFRTSTDWLTGTVRRWFALMGAVATGIGIVSFAVTAHVALAWVAIVGLLLLVVSLGWELRLAHKHAPHGVLDQAIRDGKGLLTASGTGGFGVLWQDWSNSTFDLLREHVGLVEAHTFRGTHGGGDFTCMVRAQLAYLEGLRG